MKKKLSELEPLVPTLWALQRLIDRFESRGIVIGGAAICLLGQPRLTADVDAMLEVRAERAKTLGLPPPLPYRQVTSRRRDKKRK